MAIFRDHFKILIFALTFGAFSFVQIEASKAEDFAQQSPQVKSGDAVVEKPSLKINQAPNQEIEDLDKIPKVSYLLCRKDSVVRTVRISSAGNRCIATYTKSGVDETVGNSSVKNKCFQVLNNIRINLEKGRWKCKDISQSRVSGSNER